MASPSPSPRLSALLLLLAFGVSGGGSLYVVKEPSDSVAPAGSSVVLDCAAEPRTARLSWRYSETRALDDVPVLDFRNDRYRIQLDNGSLELRSIGVGAPLGSYQCVCSDETVGTVVSRIATVSTPSLPGFISEPKDLVLYLGERAFFTCAIRGTFAKGLPTRPRTQTVDNSSLNLKIQWLKNEAPFVLDDSRMSILPSGALEIDSVNRQDHGSYRCNISLSDNSEYRLSTKGQLFVKTDLVLSETITAPRFIAEPRSQTVLEGSAVTMDCAALGNPNPDIIWLNNGVKIDLNYLDSRFTLLGPGVLYINSVQETDAGHYQCRADNKEDSLDSTAILKVQVPPRFIKKPSDKIASEREDLVFDCEVYGKPEPTIHWLKNGEIIRPNNHDMTFVNGYNLRIQGLVLSDAGIFQCIATNAVGNVQASAKLTVLNTGLKETVPIKSDEDQIYEENNKNPPSEPLDLRAVIIKPRFVTLSWNEPLYTNGEIETYTILYKVSDSERERMMNTTRKHLHEINISQLQPNTAYQFRVIAYNRNGPGRSTQILKITTQPEDQFLGPPTYLNVNVNGPKTAEVSWQPPNPVPGAKVTVDKYQLVYSELITGEDKYIITSDQSHQLTDLKPFTEYGIRVVALPAGAESDLSEGAGAPTDQVIFKTPGDSPSAAPLNVTLEAQTSTTIAIHWEAPPFDFHNGDITGYKVRYRKVGRKKADSITTAADVRSVVLKDLERMSSYQVRICAFNINGTGPFTEWYTTETLQNDLDESVVPDQPSPLKTTPGFDSIYVSWNPPKNQNIKIRGFTLGWGKGIPDVYSQVFGESIRHYTIRNLEQNSEYVISLRANNIIGDGPPVYATIGTMNKAEVDNGDDSEDVNLSIPDVPIAPVPHSPLPLIPPVGLKADVLSDTTAVVYWTDTTLPRSQITTDQRYYIIKYSPIGVQRPRYFNTTHLNCMIDDLKPHTQYEFTVKVVRGNRESPWSMVVTNSTLEASPASPPRELTVTPSTDGSPYSLSLHWLPPHKANGVITGYVILYTTDRSRRDRDWIVQAVIGGGTSALVRQLQPSTMYYFKVQARNAKGYGPFCATSSFTTLEGDDKYEVFGTIKDGRTNQFYMFLIIGVVGFLLLIGIIVGIIICCRKGSQGPPTSPDSRSKSTYQKSSASNIKPPDLWIHHDQMELKQMDKSHGSSGDGVSGMSSMSLPRPPPPRDSCEYETTMAAGGSLHHQSATGSLDKRHYVPTYVAMSSINTCGLNSGTNDHMGSSGLRSMYPRTQYGLGLGSTGRTHITIDQNTPLLSAAGSSLSGTLPSQSSMSSLGHGGHTLPMHSQTMTSTMGISPMSCSQVSYGASGVPHHGMPSSPSPSPASDGFPADAREREQGNYVAYEALHPPKDSIDESGAVGSLSRTHNPIHPLRSFSVPAPPLNDAPNTPHHHSKVSVTIRPTNTSPYKKPLVATATPLAITGSVINRLQQGSSVNHSADEIEALAPSRSTERLHQEMANLEGLMKDLNAITASQFEC